MIFFVYHTFGVRRIWRKIIVGYTTFKWLKSVFSWVIDISSDVSNITNHTFILLFYLFIFWRTMNTKNSKMLTLIIYKYSVLILKMYIKEKAGFTVKRWLYNPCCTIVKKLIIVRMFLRYKVISINKMCLVCHEFTVYM